MEGHGGSWLAVGLGDRLINVCREVCDIVWKWIDGKCCDYSDDERGKILELYRRGVENVFAGGRLHGIYFNLGTVKKGKDYRWFEGLMLGGKVMFINAVCFVRSKDV